MIKLDKDASKGIKLLKLFQLLMLDSRKHYQTDLADYLDCSAQTVIRLIKDIEELIGPDLLSGTEDRRRWYQIDCVSSSRARRLAVKNDELRYLTLCREFSDPYLTKEQKLQIDKSILRFSMLLSDTDKDAADKYNQKEFKFYPKGVIDYSPFMQTIDDLCLAIDEKRNCKVLYHTPQKEDKEHLFVPARIAVLNGAFFALGAVFEKDYKTKKHLVSFAIHRIRSLEHINVKGDYEFPPYDDKAFGLPWHEPKTFVIEIDPSASDYVKERKWADKQELEDLANGGVTLTITTQSEPELKAWVGSFLGKAKIISEISLPPNP